MRVRRSGLFFHSLSELGLYFGPEARKWKFKKFCCVHFTANQATSRDSLQSPGHQNIPQVPGNRAEVCQNHDAREAVSATLFVLKWRGCIFRPRSSKVNFQIVMLCAFHCKAGPSGSSLLSPELEKIPQVPRNRDEVAQNNDSRKAVSATLSVLKWSRAIFRSRGSKVNVQKVFLSEFHRKPRPSWVSLECPGVENIFEVLQLKPKLVKITMRARRSWLVFQS